MSGSVTVIVIHQILFQGMFFTKNVMLQRRLGLPVRAGNREARLSIAFITLFILGSILLGLSDDPFGTVDVIPWSFGLATAIVLLLGNLLVGAMSLLGLGDSWRVGVFEDQQTELVKEGIYRFSRNPYFLSYLIMFVAYTVLLQNVILLAMSLVGFYLIHAMILREEKYLSERHGELYREYSERVPRYLLLRTDKESHGDSSH